MRRAISTVKAQPTVPSSQGSVDATSSVPCAVASRHIFLIWRPSSRNVATHSGRTAFTPPMRPVNAFVPTVAAVMWTSEFQSLFCAKRSPVRFSLPSARYCITGKPTEPTNILTRNSSATVMVSYEMYATSSGTQTCVGLTLACMSS